ncbi:hypothetical protein EW026_g8000 [Hermanssonia centrifuga]|uniref:DUF6533 domain-containing protein n=1 Tax=Hermanssonia centrifuga TaxID=98765 RepID=A0A4S4K5X5_9APHY|nr:hypothetical protein EW026_g8000 [Hermanssonia centrifuga]
MSEDTAAVSALVRANYIMAGLASLTVYEYFITLRQEVTTMWGQGWTAAKLLFFVNRYVLLVLTVIGLTPTSTYERYVLRNTSDRRGCSKVL